jgi:hypothetical protein
MQVNKDTLYVPFQSTELYHNADVWKEFYIAGIETAVQRIEYPLISAFPNPTKGLFSISGVEIISLPQTIEIYNVYGHLVETRLVASPNTTFDISHLANGVYFVQVHGKRISIVKQ